MRTIALMYHDLVPERHFELSGFQSPDANVYKLDAAVLRRHLRISAMYSAQTSVIMTFDDGGVSAVQAAEVLEEFGWTGYFFITTNRIGTPGFLNEHQIHFLRCRGHIIGSHSCSHPTRMACCTTEELDWEWGESVRLLSAILGEPVTIASVPGGYYSQGVAAAAARAGIKTLFTSEPVISSTTVAGCSVIGRFAIQQRTSDRWVAGLLSGRTLPRLQCYAFWSAKKVVKRIGGTAWLHFREELLANWSSRARPGKTTPG